MLIYKRHFLNLFNVVLQFKHFKVFFAAFVTYSDGLNAYNHYNIENIHVRILFPSHMPQSGWVQCYGSNVVVPFYCNSFLLLNVVPEAF